MRCQTCKNTLDILSEIVIAVRQLPPAEQIDFRRAVMLRAKKP
jgi:hypothetical protein